MTPDLRMKSQKKSKDIFERSRTLIEDQSNQRLSLKNINHEISVIINNKYILNTGMGLCENIFNHKNIKLIKQIFS